MYIEENNAICDSLKPKYVSKTGRLALNVSTMKWLRAMDEKMESRNSDILSIISRDTNDAIQYNHRRMEAHNNGRPLLRQFGGAIHARRQAAKERQ